MQDKLMSLAEIYSPEEAEVKLIPLHHPYDEERLSEITKSMRENGWKGTPLIGWGTEEGIIRLLNGSHRYQTALDTGTDIPAVDLAKHAEAIFGGELAAEVRKAVAEVIAEDLLYDNSSIAEGIAQVLPSKVLEELGIDW